MLTTIAEIGSHSDAFNISLGSAVFDRVNERFYMRRNGGLLTVMMSGEAIVEGDEAFNELSIIGGMAQPTGVGIDERRDLPERRAAFTASPNPFSTQVELTLGATSGEAVRLEVYDPLGRRIETLFSGRLPVDQQHRFSFRAEGLPSGLYFVRYSGPGFSEVKAIVLAR